MRWVTAATAALYAACAFAGGPSEAVAAAAAHARTLPPDRAYYTKYLWLPGGAAQAKALSAQAVGGYHANHLSREPDLVPPAPVGPGLWCLDLRDYGWTREVFAKAADRDYTFRHQGVKYTPPGQTAVTGAGEWLDPAAWAELVRLTQSQYPIVRLDHFVHLTAIQADREGFGYYDFLGLGKKEADFQNLIGADPKAAKKLKLEVAASVAKSSVTLNNRGMTRLQALTGGYWFTQDYKTSQGPQNTVRLLDGDAEPPAGDASEQYGVLPNGLFAFWLQNAKGERQDAAPDFIASDGHANGNDRRVHVGLSCVRCHEPGLQPADDWSRRVLRTPLALQAVDYEKLRRLRQLYLSDLDGQLKEDNGRYARALKRLNGLTPAENARAYAEFWAAYEADVDLGRVARETGHPPEKVLAALKASARASGATDLVLAGLLAEPPVPIRFEHWEETYATVQITVMKYGGK